MLATIDKQERRTVTKYVKNTLIAKVEFVNINKNLVTLVSLFRLK